MTQTRKILFSTLASLAAAIIVLISIVLPAEYGWDPLGSGAALGLTGMSETPLTPLHHSEHGWHSDRIEFQLAAFESVEYKYYLPQGAALLYQWNAGSEVLYEMHAEPKGAAPGYAESFEKTRSLGDSGSYTAPFDGIHGWYWQNRGQSEITVTLETRGSYPYALQMTEGRSQRRDFARPAED
jgi:hypothetical protein